jgi:outer membrane protein assembly factor BamC
MQSERICIYSRSSTRMLMLAPAFLLMTGCSWLGIGGDDGWLRDRQGEYLEAQISPPMQIPANLDSFTIDELYHIPPEAPGERALYVIPPAPKPIDTRIREGVVIQRFGERAWIVIGATPGQVWPRLRDYWSTEGIQLAVEDAVSGVMETVWVPQEGSDLRHRYQLRVEPGLHAGNSEVYVRHVSDNGATPAGMPVAWPATSQSLDRETAVLASVSMYLADRTDIYRASSVSMLAGSIEIQGKARLDASRAGDTRIDLRLDFDRAWSQVGQAINNAGIEVLSSDRDASVYRVSFTGEESQERPGFFRRVFSRNRNAAVAREFHVRLVPEGNGLSVRAELNANGPAPFEQDLLIRTINDNLI